MCVDLECSAKICPDLQGFTRICKRFVKICKDLEKLRRIWKDLYGLVWICNELQDV